MISNGGVGIYACERRRTLVVPSWCFRKSGTPCFLCRQSSWGDWTYRVLVFRRPVLKVRYLSRCNLSWFSMRIVPPAYNVTTDRNRCVVVYALLLDIDLGH